MTGRRFEGIVYRRGDANGHANGDLHVRVHGQRPLPFSSPREKVSEEGKRVFRISTSRALYFEMMTARLS